MSDIAAVIESPLFGTINLGYLAEYNTYAWPPVLGVPSGYYPQSSRVPTFISYDDQILPLLEGKAIAWDQWEAFTDLSYSDMDAVVDALTNRFPLLITDVVWIFGAPDVGGVGVIKTGNDSYSVISLNGFEPVTGGGVHPRGGSLTITHPHGITISNETWGVENTVPPSGTYKTGISFYTFETVVANYDDKTCNRYYTNQVRFNAETVLSAEERINVDFTDVGPNLRASWNFWFEPKYPTGDVVKDELFFSGKKMNQWHIRSLYPYWSGPIPINVDYVEGTSLFGGESAVIDVEGNPYEIYEDTGGGGTGGGGGSQNRYSEDTLPEGVPALNLLNSGFVKLYNPTLTEVEDFARFLFSGITEDMASVIKRMMVNPIDYILALNMIHIPLTVDTAEDIGFCGISSGVSAAVVTEQYYQIEYRVDVEEFWNTALDYSSYTKCRIYVPYCGIYDISIDEIQNGTLWLRYVVDVVSGSVVAFVGTRRTQKDGTVLRATLYQYNGNCILSMPVSQTNWQNTFSSVLNIANMAIAPSPSSVAGMAQNVMSQKVSVQKSGSISANFGYLGKQTPFIILERPELSIPTDYGHHEGYPANHKRELSQVHGYTKVKENTLIYNKFSGTDEEMKMLKSVLESGVYLD